MERGEVGGRGQNSFAAWKAAKPDWLRDGRINFIVQWGAEKLPDYPDVPLLSDLAEDEGDRALLKLFSAPTVLGRPFFTTPGTPPERVAALRRAFDETMTDAVFLDAAKSGGFDLNPVTGETMEAVVKEALGTPKDIRDRLRQIVVK
jgi:tripartite-type tricarboxylate transporter receptor subunit TctC